MGQQERQYTGQHTVLTDIEVKSIPTTDACWYSLEASFSPARLHPPEGFIWEIAADSPGAAEFIGSRELLTAKVRPKSFEIIKIRAILPARAGKTEGAVSENVQVVGLFYLDFTVNGVEGAGPFFFLVQEGEEAQIDLNALPPCPAGGDFQWLRDNPNQYGSTTSSWQIVSPAPTSFQVGLSYTLGEQSQGKTKRMNLVSLGELAWRDLTFPDDPNPPTVLSGSIMQFDIPYGPDRTEVYAALGIAFNKNSVNVVGGVPIAGEI